MKVQAVQHVCDDAANAFRDTHAPASLTRPRTLLRQRESPGFGYTFTHLWNIDFRRWTAPTGKLFIYSSSARHTQGLSKPREIVPLPGRSIHTDNKAGEAKGAN